jgi:hypothetical protein
MTRLPDSRISMAPRVLVLAGLLAPLSAQSSSFSFQDLTQELASRLAAAVAPADQVTLTIVITAEGDQAAMLPIEAEIRRTFLSRGVRIVDRPEVEPALQVGCSKNLRERVCAGEVRRGATRNVVVVTRPLDPRDERPISLSLELIPIFSQPAPILDVVLAGDRLLVLDPERVTVYQRVELEREAAGDRGTVEREASDRGVLERELSAGPTRWRQLQSRPIAGSRPWPRDVRGTLRLDGATLTAWLPGAVCRGAPDLVRFACADEHGTAWPIGIENTGIDAARNYFYTPEGLPFYSAASLDRDADARWLVVANTGELRFLDAARRTVGASASGGAVAGLETPCGTGAHVLVSSSTTENRSEALRLWRVVKRQLVPSAPPIDVPGRLTALWSSPGATVATAITQNASGDRYEAFFIRVACSSATTGDGADAEVQS